MDTIEKIDILIINSNRSASSIFKELQIPHNALTEWKKGKAKPSVDALVKIADYFNVSLDYLVGREIEKLPEGFPSESEFNEDLKRLGFSVTDYDTMSLSEKMALLNTITSIAETFKKNKK